MLESRKAGTAAACIAVLHLAACGGGNGSGGSTPPPVVTYVVGGSVTGLSGSELVLVNGADQLSVAANGSFAFNTGLPGGAAYDVRVLKDPIDRDTGALTAAGTAPVAGVPGAIATRGRVLLVLNTTGLRVSSFLVDAARGALTPESTGASPVAIDIDRNGRFAYVADAVDSSVSFYRIDQSTGAITALGQAATTTTPQSLAIDPVRQVLYVAGNTQEYIHPIDTVSGAVGAGEISAPYAAGTVRVLRLDPTQRFKYRLPAPAAFDVAGRFLYRLGPGTDDILTFAIQQSGDFPAGPGAGQLTELLPRSAAPANPMSLAAEYGGKFLYVVSRGEERIAVYSIDAVTGALTLLNGGAPTGTQPAQIVVTEDVR